MLQLRNIFTCALLASSLCLMAQGATVFDFLQLPYSARQCALGGNNISLRHGDLGSAMQNPALLSGETDKQIQMSYSYYGAGQNFASVLYGHNFGRSSIEKAIDEPDRPNYFAAGIHYLNYGRMPYADEYGHLTGGEFTAQDILINAMYARQLGPMFCVGVSLKPMLSFYDVYSSFAMGADIGGHFCLPEKGLEIGLTLQNIGWQMKGFYSDEYGQALSSLPLNLELGLSYKLPHAPLRFSFTAHNLQRWNLNYQIYNIGHKENGSDVAVNYYPVTHAKWYDMLFRHTIWAVDIVPKSEKFYITLAYNHRRRQELVLKDTGADVEQKSLAGFSLGAGLNIKSVRIGLGAAQYTRSNYVMQLSLALDINQLLK